MTVGGSPGSTVESILLHDVFYLQRLLFVSCALLKLFFGTPKDPRKLPSIEKKKTTTTTLKKAKAKTKKSDCAKGFHNK